MDEFERESRMMDLEREKTELKKEQFIKQIRSGLGDHIKKTGGKVKKVKKSAFRRFLIRLMEIF
jgi:hypothetical protein|tara:strand:+ start:646 stop:837 length:192 start_codon:yes stop_codon:yes gene_type:complete